MYRGTTTSKSHFPSSMAHTMGPCMGQFTAAHGLWPQKKRKRRSSNRTYKSRRPHDRSVLSSKKWWLHPKRTKTVQQKWKWDRQASRGRPRAPISLAGAFVVYYAHRSKGFSPCGLFCPCARCGVWQDSRIVPAAAAASGPRSWARAQGPGPGPA